MLEELQRRNYATTTVQDDIQAVEREPELRTVPRHELADRVLVGSLAAGRLQTVQHRRPDVSRSGSARTRLGAFLRDFDLRMGDGLLHRRDSFIERGPACPTPGLPIRLLTPYSDDMTPLRARVQNGRLRLDQPTGLPEGTELDLVIDDEGDDLTEHERQALHEALSTSWTSAQAGKLRPAAAIIDELRRKR